MMRVDFSACFAQNTEKIKSSPNFQKIYEDGGRFYEGEIVNNMKHGTGTIQTEFGETYVG